MNTKAALHPAAFTDLTDAEALLAIRAEMEDLRRRVGERFGCEPGIGLSIFSADGSRPVYDALRSLGAERGSAGAHAWASVGDDAKGTRITAHIMDEAEGAAAQADAARVAHEVADQRVRALSADGR